ncbi:3-phosphoshikimate 1-carboxyvinyltransferase [Idiomarina sp. HP20-50]|uniref:3-phosphoshikimate 1-carboxyvinyltransferase n=1 Tax=Idiomarina sp. HP20-50 TaxID=3070813 RepID=UPI00294B32EF|nr:3-phosphoshikimate 1-carboxyvinyltransferase [Idiomarina sp. HP20-50]MDV6315045.1 3-phosphoshikimate 1-carboxyvinyltransferase [Idiomarina sp. HP20-50]
MVNRIDLNPRRFCRGSVTLPGSKSIANRALLMAALCETPVTLHNLLVSDDTDRMREALLSLGVTFKDDKLITRVEGLGGQWQKFTSELYLGNAGTAMRPLIAVLAATLANDPMPMVLKGDARMHERPVEHLVDALIKQGASINYLGESGFPPLAISGGLAPGDFEIDGSVSSQFISALLMALPLLNNDSTLTLKGEVVSRPYIELTLQMLSDFGIRVETLSSQRYRIAGGQRYQSPGEYWVEGDASAASYWMAAALMGKGPLEIIGVGENSIQGDKRFAEVIEQMGASVSYHSNSITVIGTGAVYGIDQDFNDIPDAAMTVAPLALFADKPTVIRNVANWRVKETDRLHAMATELRKVGARVEEGEDYLRIEPVSNWQHATIETYDDHRMAMCFSLIAFSPIGVTIKDPDCCAKTYPDYFSEFSRLCHS